MTDTKIENSESEVTVGLLGTKIDMRKFHTIGGKYIIDARLEEIERRILALEAKP